MIKQKHKCGIPSAAEYRPRTPAGGEAVRRMGDILISLLCLGLLWPLMLTTVLLLLMEEPGASPVFLQTRVGRDGREFTLFKFRSMIPGAEAQLEELLPRNEMDGPVFKLRRDPRITPLGRFLRRSSIDELPQLFNVLRGAHEEIEVLLKSDINHGDFFRKAPALNPNRSLIKGSICGIKVELIEDPLMQNIRYLDKLVDELAKGKAMEKILRK